MPKFGKFSVPKPKNQPKSSSGSLIRAKKKGCESSIFVKKSVSASSQIWCWSVLQVPIFSYSGCTPLLKWKLSTPLGVKAKVSLNQKVFFPVWLYVVESNYHRVVINKFSVTLWDPFIVGPFVLYGVVQHITVKKTKKEHSYHAG